MASSRGMSYSQEIASKGPNRRTIFDDVQDKASKMPGPGVITFSFFSFFCLSMWLLVIDLVVCVHIYIHGWMDAYTS